MKAEELMQEGRSVTIEEIFLLDYENLKIFAKKIFEIEKGFSTKKQLQALCVVKYNEALQKYNQSIVSRFVKNEKNQQDAVRLALQLKNLRSSWFSSQEMFDVIKSDRVVAEVKKNVPTEADLKARLETLRLFGLVKKKSHSHGRMKFKIFLGTIHKAMVEIKRKQELERIENARGQSAVTS